MDGAISASLILALAASAGADEAAPRHRSPFDVVISPDGGTAYVSDRTAGALVVLDLSSRRPRREVALRGQPTGLAITPGGERVYAAEYSAGTIAEIDAAEGRVLRRLPAGLRPAGIALSPRRGKLIAANTTEDEVSIIDLASGKEASRVRLPREPFFVAVTPDESLAVVGNLLPATAAADPQSSAAVSLIDLEQGLKQADIRLPQGSTSVREVQVAPAGRFAYVVHTVGRFNVPSTQTDRGWVYTNALSLIDLRAREVHATLLLDTLLEGAGNPWGVELAPDGSTLWVSLRGTHQLARVDLERLEPLLRGEVPDALATPAPSGLGTQNIWFEMKRDPRTRARLGEDLTALHAAGVIRRHSAGGRGPRGLALSPDGASLLAACYHSGEVAVIETVSGRLLARIPVGPAPEPDLARRGEIIFHDATVSFGHWMSCSSCHPDEGRTDGLRWDLVNDGLGTPQNTRSLLWAHLTRPTTARGVRPGIEASVPAGFYFMGVTPAPGQVEAVTAYLSSLRPEPSPRLGPGERLTESAARGEALFEGKAGCSSCHQGPTRSDLKLHDVGTGDLERPGERFVTKRLVELYRTAPYLHDGRAASLRDVFTRHNARGRHGKWHELTEAERADLLEYLLSL